MRYTIQFLDSALFDLETIKKYVSFDSVSAAIQLLNEFRVRIDNLCNMPERNPLCEDDPRFRRMVVGRYLVFYYVDEQQKNIEIHHVWHGMRNIEKLLREQNKQ